jgi:hypothetical protein
MLCKYCGGPLVSGSFCPRCLKDCRTIICDYNLINKDGVKSQDLPDEMTFPEKALEEIPKQFYTDKYDKLVAHIRKNP